MRCSVHSAVVSLSVGSDGVEFVVMAFSPGFGQVAARLVDHGQPAQELGQFAVRAVGQVGAIDGVAADRRGVAQSFYGC